jgi:hypothetical protein
LTTIPAPVRASDGSERRQIMVVQKRLQQVFSQQTSPMPVWHWDYERGRGASLYHNLMRAKVAIPYLSAEAMR